MSSNIKLMRDAFLETIYEEMVTDSDIYFLTADFGAVALDKMRSDFPDRVFHMGICEQNMVDFAAGLSLSGKKVFLYAMAPFLIARAFEQIKSVVSAMNLPMTFVGVGVGLGYDHATLTHFTPEDFALSRVIRGMQVYTPSDDLSAVSLAKKILRDSDELSYVRLERSKTERLEATKIINDSFRILSEGDGDLVVMASGYMTHVLNSLLLTMPHLKIAQIDVLKNIPLEVSLLKKLATYSKILVVEEQSLQGGIASSLFEAFQTNPQIMMPRVYSIALDRQIKISNGDRGALHRLNGISEANIRDKIMEVLS